MILFWKINASLIRLLISCSVIWILNVTPCKAFEEVDPKVQMNNIILFFEMIDSEKLPTVEVFDKLFHKNTEYHFSYDFEGKQWVYPAKNDPAVFIHCLKKLYPKSFSSKTSRLLELTPYELKSQEGMVQRYYSIFANGHRVSFNFDYNHPKITDIYIFESSEKSYAPFSSLIKVKEKREHGNTYRSFNFKSKSVVLGSRLSNKCRKLFYEELNHEKLPPSVSFDLQ